MKSMKDMRQELRLKEQRVAYWERFHMVPRVSDLIGYGRGEENVV